MLHFKVVGGFFFFAFFTRVVCFHFELTMCSEARHWTAAVKLLSGQEMKMRMVIVVVVFLSFFYFFQFPGVSELRL